jgi:hypothetical protein
LPAPGTVVRDHPGDIDNNGRMVGPRDRRRHPAKGCLSTAVNADRGAQIEEDSAPC